MKFIPCIKPFLHEILLSYIWRIKYVIHLSLSLNFGSNLFNRYLPPYTTFLPVRDHRVNDVKRDQKSLVECLVFSQLSYLVIFIILICITERQSLKEDPLNFNVLNITLEVIRQVMLYLELSFVVDYF